MKIITKKNITAVLIIMMTFATAFVALPLAKAQLQIAPFLSVVPDPCGVGQTLTLNAFTQPIPPTSNDRFDNISVTMTKPDGTKQTFGPVRGGPLGNWVWLYTPDTAGTYLFQMHIADQHFPNSPAGNVVYKGADGPIVNVTVQQEPIAGMPDTPLPTQYWTYPINAQNRLWAATSGAWLRASYDGSGFNPYTTSTSGHILWRYRNAFGGLEGGPNGYVAYAQGRAYEGKMTPTIVISNYFYQYGPIGDVVNNPNLLNCINIETGQVVWSKNITATGVSVGSVPIQGQIFEYDSSNQVGLHAYLWYMGSTSWTMYDAFNGNWIMDWANVTTGGESIITFEKNGNMLRYQLDTVNGWMACWNFTKACVGTTTSNGVITWQSQEEKNQYGVAGGQWRPRSSALSDWKRGIEWNVTVPKETQWMAAGRTLSLTYGGVTGPGGILVGESQYSDAILNPRNIQEIFGYSLDPANPRKLWGPVNLTSTVTTTRAISGEDGVYILGKKETMQYVAYDVNTGALLWESDPASYPWGTYLNQSPIIAHHRLYSGAYDGLWCWDIKTGKALWHFSAGDSGTETPYGTWVGRAQMVGGDTVYFWTGAWHPTEVMARGDRMFAVNATTGQCIWNKTCFADGVICAQGKLIFNDLYDNEIYCVGKGPSATTVSASVSAPTGSSVVIQGTVTDQSQGDKTKGTACIADQNMGEWMDYLWSQQPMPTSAKGVSVSIDAIDPNGNFIHLGDATSTITGRYSLVVDSSNLAAGPGTYQIIASFGGTNSYWSSSADTTLQIEAAPSAAPTAAPVNFDAINNSIMTYTLAAAIAIIIAIAIAVLLLRKKA